MWFLGQAYYDQQQKGFIPANDDFDPYSVIARSKDGQLIRTYDPAESSRSQHYRYYQRGIVRTLAPVTIRGQDRADTYDVCLAVAYMDGGVLLTTGCFKSINFGYFLPGDIAEDIALIDLALELPKFSERIAAVRRYEDVEKEFRRWKFKYWDIFRDTRGYPAFRFTYAPNKA